MELHGQPHSRRPGAERRWSVTHGAIASFDHGNVDRDHVFVQASYADRALWDYNPILSAYSYVNSSKAGWGRF